MGKRRSFLAKEKLAVVEHMKATGDSAATVAHFFPGLSAAAAVGRCKLIWGWSRDEAKLLAACETRKSASRKKARPLGLTTALSPEIENELVVWINDLRGEGVPISSRMLALHAKELALAHNVAASWWWQKRFMARNKLSLRARTRQGQVTSPQLAKIAKDFGQLVNETMTKLDASTIYNADQTAAFFEYLPKITINQRGAKTVWVRCGGKSEEKATVMLLGDSDGRKYSPFVVFKTQRSTVQGRHEENLRERNGFGRAIWRELELLPHDLQVHGNAKGWWNAYLSIKFLRYHFGNLVDPVKPVLLLWDDFSGHWTREVTRYASTINVTLLKVPPSATSVCQPADVAWNKPLKETMRSC